ncbi:MAG: hypothetical protein WC465_02575 [Patescibacteria group bacterium]
MKMLITGIGITGKSTLRRSIVQGLKSRGCLVLHFDADHFPELRDQRDADILTELPAEFRTDTSYIIEDVHATLKDAVLPLKSYDFIIYLYPSFFSQLMFWLNRIPHWYRSGHHSWEAELGWRGSGKPRDKRNLRSIAKQLWRNMRLRRKWLCEDMIALRASGVSVCIVKSRWSKNGPKFIWPSG